VAGVLLPTIQANEAGAKLLICVAMFISSLS
jgi:hypothetical protein